mmetsp:Transcript_29475/g.21299  ORF Transcript_29475/g.21299 Transcript_29475/m.21299 type:complete len:120 (-) Transcript_29475:117-476(-)
MKNLLRCFGQKHSDDEIKRIIEENDDDQSGSISFPEFIGIMSKIILEPDIDEEVTEAYKVFDRTGEGIKAEDLAYVMTKMGYPTTDEEAKEMIDEEDWDGDEMLGFEEFTRVIMGKNGH